MKLYSSTSTYRSPFAAIQDVQISKKAIWTLTDILREKRLKEALAEVGSGFRQRLDVERGPAHRFSIVRKVKGNVWHGSGIGDFTAENFDEVKAVIASKGYNRIKYGGVKIKLS